MKLSNYAYDCVVRAGGLTNGRIGYDSQLLPSRKGGLYVECGEGQAQQIIQILTKSGVVALQHDAATLPVAPTSLGVQTKDQPKEEPAQPAVRKLVSPEPEVIAPMKSEEAVASVQPESAQENKDTSKQTELSADTPLTQVPWLSRGHNALTLHGLKTLGDVVKLSENELLEVPKIGKTFVEKTQTQREAFRAQFFGAETTTEVVDDESEHEATTEGTPPPGGHTVIPNPMLDDEPEEPSEATKDAAEGGVTPLSEIGDNLTLSIWIRNAKTAGHTKEAVTAYLDGNRDKFKLNAGANITQLVDLLMR